MAGRVGSTKLTKFFTYSRTAQSKTEYAGKMKRLSNQIFGEVRFYPAPVHCNLPRAGAEADELSPDGAGGEVLQPAPGAEGGLGYVLPRHRGDHGADEAAAGVRTLQVNLI